MKPAILVLPLCALALPALADTVKVENAWVRATAPGQQVAGAFMDLTADADMAVVDAASPAAKVVQLHSMAMDNGVMVMRRLKAVALPKGKTVSLKPGGMHVMLIDLVGPIKAGAHPSVTLTVRAADGKKQRIAVPLEVREPGASGN
ncbi:copper chaperone PCu(A)C [Parasulfuritortus cantonensis]|uniref:Copper chaperone PCu(A)C n=1 Tax=Parasulfuritortus cantonensis TaxID=2528202 RepID=A0A4R1BCG5_9PROT|nr:copper chaperone PCu(A)C [Parasulfuritortus cantonensis]TCJ14726.1 copper chaperone PCu(A)C [Parasulfuritortus cantonensis]